MKLSLVSLFFNVAALLPLLCTAQDNATTTTTDAAATADNNSTTPAGPGPAPGPAPAPEPALTSCSSSAACEDGFFCSLSTGQCETLTCANWAAGAPVGDLTYSEVPCVAEGAEEGTQFCGWDGTCRDYTCLNWYTYGPVEFTGYDPQNPVQLECNNYDSGAEDDMNSVIFGCRPWQPGNIAPENLSWTHFFNQECLAKPRNGDEFKCYQNAPGTSYQDYVGEAARKGPPSCDRAVYVDNEQPLFWYIVQARQERATNADPINYKHGRDNTLSGDSFNENLAENTMYAVIISDSEAPAQTYPLPQEEGTPTTDDTDGAGMSVPVTTTMWMALITAGVCLFL